MMVKCAALAVVAAGWAVRAALSSPSSSHSYAVTDLKISVTSSRGGEVGDAQRAEFPGQIKEPIHLRAGEAIRITYVVKGDGEDSAAKDVLPHQNMAVLQDKSTGMDYSRVASMKENGRSRIDLNPTLFPGRLLSTTGPFSLSILIGNPSSQQTLRWLLSDDVTLSADLLKQVPSPEYGPKDEIHWTFDPPGKRPPNAISMSFVLIVLAPWIILLSIWSWLGVNLATYSSMPPSVGGPALAFLGCLAGFEFLFYEYWVRLRLPDLLLYGAALGLLTFIVGRQSLSGLIRMRKRREGLVNADKTS